MIACTLVDMQLYHLKVNCDVAFHVKIMNAYPQTRTMLMAKKIHSFSELNNLHLPFHSDKMKSDLTEKFESCPSHLQTMIIVRINK